MAGLRLAAHKCCDGGECGVTEGGMFWTLVLAAAIAGSDFASIDFLTNGNSTQNKSEGWMANLRRQLMHENYDYEPSSDEPGLLPGLLDEEPEPTEPGGGAPGPADDEPREDVMWLDQSNEIKDQPTTVNSLYVPTFRNYPDEIEFEMKEKTGRRLSRLSALVNVSRGTRRRGVSQQDLLYYVDDAWLHRDDENADRRADRDDNELSSGDSGDSDLSDGRRAFEAAPTTRTYKLLKLPGSARRDGLGPRFVEERSAQGVALLSLDGAPFPQFRLPRERRQYQAKDLD